MCGGRSTGTWRSGAGVSAHRTRALCPAGFDFGPCPHYDPRRNARRRPAVLTPALRLSASGCNTLSAPAGDRATLPRNALVSADVLNHRATLYVRDMARSWTLPPPSKSAVNKAGVEVAMADDTSLADPAAIQLVQDWRASHSFPLNTVQIGLRRQAALVSSSPLISQRLKRLPSVVKKLRRSEMRMKLARMQDLGGCRAVVRTPKQVDALLERLTSTAGKRQSRYEFRGDPTDYIRAPQPSGYRSLHLVVQYVASAGARTAAWNGLQVEVQLRTAVQHAWATSVEIVDIVSGTDLKGGSGPDAWKRFFVLASAAMALQEGTPGPANTPHTTYELRDELVSLNEHLRALHLLRNYTLTLGMLGQQLTNTDYRSGNRYVLINLDASAHRFTFKQFRLTDVESALDAYGKLEREVADDPLRDVVLVVTDSIKALSRAYPTYAGDANRFVRLLRGFMYGERTTSR